QTSLSPSRGSPDASAALRPLLGNRRHPQESPRVTRGVPGATSEPGGGSGWQRPSPLGTSPVPLSPSCATCRAESHQEDVTQDLAPRELGWELGDLGSWGWTLGGFGVDIGGFGAMVTGIGAMVCAPVPSCPHVPSSPPVPSRPQLSPCPPGYSPELVAALRTGRVPDCAQDELALTADFERPEQGQRWPGGRLKSSFNYLLLDPRVTQDLPRRSPGLSPAERFRTFVAAVFYVGKGTRARPWWHLHQALAQHLPCPRCPQGGPKVRRIVSLWAAGQGVVALQCFQHRVPAEALTRESCMLQALGLQALTNARGGPCYGVAAAWPGPRRRRLGVLLLHRAMGVLLAEGESHIYPGDVPGVTHSTLR
uniref:ANKL1 protein n=1 Tax=Cyanoderma ruficeps TaxID=181631 RepID=A0A8C3R4T4_9PASS